MGKDNLGALQKLLVGADIADTIHCQDSRARERATLDINDQGARSANEISWLVSKQVDG